jgi:hypothetical protein
MLSSILAYFVTLERENKGLKNKANGKERAGNNNMESTKNNDVNLTNKYLKYYF